MCGFLANTKDWDIISIPPTMTAAKTDETSFRHRTDEHHLDLCKPFDWTRTALNTNAGAQGLKLLRDLKCQLPGGGEDEGVKPLG